MNHMHSLLFLVLLLVVSITCFAQSPSTNPDYLEFNYGQETEGEQWIQSIEVDSPAYRSTIKGDTRITFRAPGMKAAKAFCWQ